jgi:hypothetical protein
MTEIRDGLEVLREVMSLREVASLIERTARWVAPDTFKLLPLWFPEHARRAHYFKGNWSEPQMNQSRATGTSVHKSEGNVFANKALTLALGLRKRLRPNWACCHIWGVDDASYQLTNVVVADHRFFRAWAIWYFCPHRSKPSRIRCWMSKRCCGFAHTTSMAGGAITEVYLKRMPPSTSGRTGRGIPKAGRGHRTKSYNWNSPALAGYTGIRREASRQDTSRQEHAGERYPRDRVRDAMEYWKITL